MTTFQTVYDAFFILTTDDMYLEITEEETIEDCRALLMASIPMFEFPNQILTFNDESFVAELTLEEINILAWGMFQLWLQRQTASIENVRQKFSGADFRLTSQSSHLQRLMALLNQTKEEHRRLQMLYSRREVRGNRYESTFGMLVRRT
jgi:hypothetical protein